MQIGGRSGSQESSGRPFEGLRPEPVPRRRHRRRCCLSGGSLLYRVLYATDPWAHLVTHARLDLAVSDGKSGFSPVAVPRFLAKAGSSSRELHASSEYCRPEPAPRLPAWSPFLGVRIPSTRHQPGASVRRVSTPAAFPSSAFLTPSTVCAAPCLVGLFHPTATSRVRPAGVCASNTAATPRRRHVPSRRWRRSAVVGYPTTPQPAASPSGPCSVSESVAAPSGFNRRRDPIPS
jgi:hypothetical protein